MQGTQAPLEGRELDPRGAGRGGGEWVLDQFW